MKRYRVWLTNVAMQSIVVQADDERDARQQVNAMVEECDIPFEDKAAMELTSLWEVTSIDELTHEST
jgi:hypothetical protein